MKKIFIKNKDLKENQVTLNKELFHHLKNVLRITKGAQLQIIIDQQQLLKVQVASISKNLLSFQLIASETIKASPGPQIVLAQALPKQDKFTTIINICTQMGISKLIPFISSRVVPDINGKEQKKWERWQTALISAVMQSQRNTIPILEKIISLEELANYSEQNNLVKLALWESATTHLKKIINNAPSSPNYTYLICIGPEGGFSSKEIELLTKNGFQAASIGKNILRTEYAGFAALSMLQYALEPS